tara:strand:- start:2062 stop:3081 length:1020 start_codon:yes stop_codon:yes gene_type:complete
MNKTLINSILITGGTGSFGKAFLAELLLRYPDIERVVIYSRDELKQWELQQKYPEKKYPQLRFFIGDIRDKERLKRALDQVEIVVHAAALKQVVAAEYNPFEFIRTNVIGAENIVQACLESNVRQVIALSTDKASSPINLYGATKLCQDKLFVAANNVKGEKDIKFSVVRYGNVMGSRGSVIPLFLRKAPMGTLEITNPNMTRFNISLKEGVDMVLWAMNNNYGGEIFVPKIPSYRISDLAEAIGPSCKKKICGIRPGEKLHEEMISTSDSYSTIDLGKYYAILPTYNSPINEYKISKEVMNFVKEGFNYTSDINDEFLTVNKLRNLIIHNIDKNFVPF